MAFVPHSNIFQSKNVGMKNQNLIELTQTLLGHSRRTIEINAVDLKTSPDVGCKRRPPVRLSVNLFFLFPAGRRLLYLLLCHSAAKPRGDNSGEKSVGPAEFPLPSERCAAANP